MISLAGLFTLGITLFTSMAVLMSLFVDLTTLYSRVTHANKLLAQLASRDGLTGLANRRTFDEMLRGTGANGGRAHLLEEACNAPLP